MRKVKGVFNIEEKNDKKYKLKKKKGKRKRKERM